MFCYNQNNYFEEAVLGIISRMTSNIFMLDSILVNLISIEIF